MSSWQTRRLGDVIEAKYGKALPKSKRRGGSVPVHGSSGVVGYHDVALTRGPTIIVGRKGSLGAVNSSSVACWPIDTTYYVDDPGPFSIEFLDQLLRSLGLSELDTSTAIPGLNRNQLYDLEVPVPSPDEQKAIVTALGKVEHLGESASTHVSLSRRALHRVRQAILAAASSGRIGKGSFEEWKVMRLGDVAARVTKGTTPTSYGHNFAKSGIAFIKVENLRHGRIDRASIRSFISDETNRAQERSILEEGDVLFSIAGTIGRTAIVGREDIPANTNQALAIIRGTSHLFEPEYLVIALQSAVQEAAAGAARGSGMNNISLADVKNFELSVPPKEQQVEIVRRVNDLLTAAESLVARLDAVSVALERTKQAVPHKAFRGELSPEDVIA